MVRLANRLMLFNAGLFVLLALASCDAFKKKPYAHIVWKIETINGVDTVFYECKLVHDELALASVTYRICDSKTECNDYCDQLRKELQAEKPHDGA